MATTTITPTTISKNSGQLVTQGTGTAINTSNTMEIAYPDEGRLLVLIDSDNAATSATFAAGFGVDSGLGSLAVAVADTKMTAVVLDSARFKDSSGNLSITWAASSAGFVQAYYLPY